MSTRSLIGITDGTRLTYAYMHSDGYPEWTGRILLRHHNTADAAARLVAKGDLPGLGEDGGVGTCADATEPAKAALRRLTHCANGLDAEWIYLWQDGRWYVAADQRNSERRIDYTRTYKDYTDLQPLQYVINNLSHHLPGALPYPPCATPRGMYHLKFQ